MPHIGVVLATVAVVRPIAIFGILVEQKVSRALKYGARTVVTVDKVSAVPLIGNHSVFISGARASQPVQFNRAAQTGTAEKHLSASQLIGVEDKTVRAIDYLKLIGVDHSLEAVDIVGQHVLAWKESYLARLQCVTVNQADAQKS